MCAGTACFVTAPHWEEGQGKSEPLSDQSLKLQAWDSFILPRSPSQQALHLGYYQCNSATSLPLCYPTGDVPFGAGMIWWGGIIFCTLHIAHQRMPPSGSLCSWGLSCKEHFPGKAQYPPPSYCHGTYTLTEVPTIWLHLRGIINHVSKTLFLLCDANQNSHPLGR